MNATDNALSYVGPIMDAYNAAEKSGASALSFALECGKQLNAAMMTVEAAKPKRTWKSWRDEHLQVSEETERLYRRLASAVAQDENFAKCKSIRDAMKHLAKYEIKDGILVLKPEKTPRQSAANGNSVTGLQPPPADTPSTDPATILQDIDAGEIIDNIKDDPEKVEEVAAQSIARLSPDKVCVALTKAWDAEQLLDLVKRVNVYLSTLTGTSASSSNYRRPAAQPELKSA